MSDFVHLHLHSQYSLLDGANRLDEVIAAAMEMGMPAIALTDHGNMFGAIELYDRARAAGIKPILGVEAYVAQGSRLDRTPGRGSSNHLVLLARDETGYRNLLKLTSAAYLEGFYYKPRIDKELLRKHSAGLICLSACLKGEINEKIVANQEKEAEATARDFLDIFGEGNFYLEMQDHGIPEQRLANEVLRRISRRTGIPLVVSNDCHYHRKDDAFAHDVLLCIGTQKTLSDPDRMRYATDNFYFKTAEEMHQLFPDDHAAIENTLAIAERCNLVIPMEGYQLPEFSVPAGESLQTYFEKVVRNGLDERLVELRARRRLRNIPEERYRERLEYEIGVIETMGFEGYFLVVWDFIRYAREHDIPVGPGRGSAAGSVVSWSLRITGIDPLEYDLLFERFLNPERISMPDIDIDFCMRRRGEVIQYVTEKYGRDRVAQIITFGTLAAKAVIRDVGRVLGLPYTKVDRIAKMIPDMTKSLAQAARDVDALRSEMEQDPEIKQIVDVGSRLEGLTRHASVHAAGIVITPHPLDDMVPLYKTTKGDEEQVMTQWDMNVIEKLGLLKMDFLGLRTLTVLDDAVKILKQQGVDLDLDLDAVALDDPEVFRLFCEGRTSGIFQFESRGMTDLLRRFKPSRFEDLAALNALYRPGAMTLVDEYIQRKQGKKFAYLTPEMQPILEETYGIIVYQEQVMLIGVAVAGFSMADADMLRKAMGKKKADVMAKMKEKFVDGAAGRGMPRQRASELWDKIEPFAGYGFNKSHSVAYAMVAYKTAYLKVHHPVAFMAAMLNSELSSSDAIAKYVAEARNNMGIEILPPDVNESGYFFTVVGDRIRFGLGALKGVGEGAIESLLEARRRLGRFSSLSQVATEIDLRLANRKVFECLCKAGAFDEMGPHRAAVWTALDDVLDYGQHRRREREDGQSSLFGTGGGSHLKEPAPDPATPPWPERERVKYEKEALGFYLTGNPLTEHQTRLERLITHTTAALREGAEGTVTLGGIVSSLSRVKIKSGPNAGKYMGRFVLDDLEGSLPVTLFASQLEKFGHLLADDAVVLVKGQVRERGGSDIEITVEEIVPVVDLGPALTEVELVLEPARISTNAMLKLSDLLKEHPGEVPVTFQLQLPDRTVWIAPRETYKVELSPDLAASIEGLLGQGCVHERYEGSAWS